MIHTELLDLLNMRYIVALLALNELIFATAVEMGELTGWHAVVGDIELFPKPKGLFKRVVTSFHSVIVAFVFWAVGYDQPQNAAHYAVDMAINALVAVGLYDMLVKFAKGLIKHWAEKYGNKKETL